VCAKPCAQSSSKRSQLYAETSQANGDSDYYRAGSAQSFVMAHGQHEAMERPRGADGWQ